MRSPKVAFFFSHSYDVESLKVALAETLQSHPAAYGRLRNDEHGYPAITFDPAHD